MIRACVVVVTALSSMSTNTLAGLPSETPVKESRSASRKGPIWLRGNADAARRSDRKTIVFLSDFRLPADNIAVRRLSRALRFAKVPVNVVAMPWLDDKRQAFREFLDSQPEGSVVLVTQKNVDPGIRYTTRSPDRSKLHGVVSIFPSVGTESSNGVPTLIVESQLHRGRFVRDKTDPLASWARKVWPMDLFLRVPKGIEKAIRDGADLSRLFDRATSLESSHDYRSPTWSTNVELARVIGRFLQDPQRFVQASRTTPP